MRVRDYCTMAPDKVFGHDISHCCKEHDHAYYNQSGKIKADIRFFRCLRVSSGLFTASIYYLGVTAFGLPFYLHAKYKKWSKNLIEL